MIILQYPGKGNTHTKEVYSGQFLCDYQSIPCCKLSFSLTLLIPLAFPLSCIKNTLIFSYSIKKKSEILYHNVFYKEYRQVQVEVILKATNNTILLAFKIIIQEN